MEHGTRKIGTVLKFELIFLCRSLLSQAKLLVLMLLARFSNYNKNAAKSILFVQTANLGDAVILIPVIKALQREQYQVEVISNSYTKSLFEYFDISVIATFDEARSSRSHFNPVSNQKIGLQKKYDRVIYIRGSIYLMCLLVKEQIGKIIVINHIPIQITIRLKRYLKFSATTHILDLIVKQIKVFEPTLSNARIFLEMDNIRGDITPKTLVAINVDSPYELRSINIDVVIKVIAYLNEAGFSNVKIIGYLKDRNRRALDVRRKELNFEIVENSSIAGLVELLRNTKIYIGPDSGPLHLANMLGAQCIGFYGPDSPDAFGIVNGRSASRIFYSNFGCSPCYQGYCHRQATHSHCMTYIDDDIIKRIVSEGTPAIVPNIVEG